MLGNARQRPESQSVNEVKGRIITKCRDTRGVKAESRQRKGVLDSKLAARKPRNIVTYDSIVSPQRGDVGSVYAHMFAYVCCHSVWALTISRNLPRSMRLCKIYEVHVVSVSGITLILHHFQS